MQMVVETWPTVSNFEGGDRFQIIDLERSWSTSELA